MQKQYMSQHAGDETFFYRPVPGSTSWTVRAVRFVLFLGLWSWGVGLGVAVLLGLPVGWFPWSGIGALAAHIGMREAVITVLAGIPPALMLTAGGLRLPSITGRLRWGSALPRGWWRWPRESIRPGRGLPWRSGLRHGRAATDRANNGACTGAVIIGRERNAGQLVVLGSQACGQSGEPIWDGSAGLKLFLGEGPVISRAVDQAAAGFEGMVIRVAGGPRASSCLYGERQIHLAPHTVFDTDPMVQAREDAAAWSDIGAMVAALPLSPQQQLLARALWAMGLELLPVGLRRFANLADFCRPSGEVYRKLGGWLAASRLVPADERWRIGAMLDAWRARPDPMPQLLIETRTVLCAAGCPARPYGPMPVRLASAFRTGGVREILFEADLAKEDSGLRMRLRAQLAALLADISDPARPMLDQPCLFVLDADCDPQLVAQVMKARRALLARRITILLHATTPDRAREQLSVPQGARIADQVSTVVMAAVGKGDASQMLGDLALSPTALDRAKPNELFVATAKHGAMRLDPVADGPVRRARPSSPEEHQSLLWAKPPLVIKLGPPLPEPLPAPPPPPAQPSLPAPPAPALAPDQEQQISRPESEVLPPEPKEAHAESPSTAPKRRIRQNLRRVLARRL